MAFKTFPTKESSMSSDDLFIFAGEASGDLHGKELLHSLRTLCPTLSIFGVGGPKMREEKMESLLKMEEFQVIGFFDILLSLPSLFWKFYFLRRAILKRNPKIALFIDYPGFSLRLERSLHKKGFEGKVIHYIAPTVWAWGKKRIPLMEKNVDLLLSIFPFEKQFFQKSSLQVEYVGHPLAKKIAPPQHKAQKERWIGIFPGSRKKEVVRNLPFQIEAIRSLFLEDSSLYFYISIAHPHLASDIFSLIGPLQEELKEHLLFFSGEETEKMMEKTSFAIAKSGTVTLELALHEIPTIVIYAITSWDLFLIRHILKIHLPHYCIVNILLNKEVFPELYGPNLTKENLCFWAKEFLQKEPLLQEKRSLCQKLRHHLTKETPPQNAADLIFSVYQNS